MPARKKPITRKKTAVKPKKTTRTTKNKNRRVTSRSVIPPLKFSKRQLLIFALIFGAIGAYIIFRSMAATIPVGTLEAERDLTTKPADAQVISESLLFKTNGTASGSVALSQSANQFVVRAKGVQCSGAPQMIVKVGTTTFPAISVSSTGLADYPVTIPNPATAGNQPVSISFTNDNIQRKGKSGAIKCSRDLYVDKITFNGVTSDPVPDPDPIPATSNKLYWGGRIGYPDLPDAPWGTAAWDRFETNAGKEISYLQFGQPFGSLDTNALNIVRNRGAIPHVETLTRLPDGTSFSVTQIAQGQADSYMTSFCTKAKAWSYPFVFRFLWEFNGPWQDTYYGSSNSYAFSRPADYVAAWKRFHGICQQIGATNITWHWNANWWTTGTNAVDPRPWWPGIDYVDMVGVDAYADGRTLTQLMATAYPVLTSLAAGKPMYLETGSYESGAGGSHIPPAGWTKAQWITDMFAHLPNYPAFDVFQWFNDGEVGRPSENIETSPEATAAFKAGIANDRYLPQAQSHSAFTKFPNL